MDDGRVPATSKLIPHDDMTDYCKKLCVLPRPLRRSPESTHRVWMSSPAAITPGMGQQEARAAEDGGGGGST